MHRLVQCTAVYEDAIVVHEVELPLGFPVIGSIQGPAIDDEASHRHPEGWTHSGTLRLELRNADGRKGGSFKVLATQVRRVGFSIMDITVPDRAGP